MHDLIKFSEFCCCTVEHQNINLLLPKAGIFKIKNCVSLVKFLEVPKTI